MSSFQWLIKFKKLAKRPPFFILQGFLNKVPGRLLQVGQFFVLELIEPTLKSIRGLGVVRKGVPTDVLEMCKLENKEAVFLKRFNEGELCAVAIHEGQIIGYVWFSDKAFHLEDRYKYRLTIPNDSIYAYDGFIKPENRLGGTWLILMKFVLDQAQSLGRKKVIAMIDYGNDLSLKTHLRFGFNVFKKVIWTRLFNKNMFQEKKYLPGCFNLRQANTR